MFNVSFVDIGYEISTRTHSRARELGCEVQVCSDVAFAFRSVRRFNEFCKFWKRS